MANAKGLQTDPASAPSDAESALPRADSTPELRALVEADRRGQPFLRYRDGSGAQRLYTLEQRRRLAIGRSSEIDLSLPWDQSISSVHAEMVPLGRQWLISDEGISRNGTFVNDEHVRGRRRLRHGDTIRVGHTTLTFNEASAGSRDATTVVDSGVAVGTVTLLFTDLVGSTELMGRLGDEAGDRLRREHFAVLRDAATEHRGQEVKSLGDGLMIAFTSSLSALACATDMQRRISTCNADAGGEQLGLRIGLNAGEVLTSESDYFGMPVIIAKRLCDRAGRGQVLLAEVVRALAGNRGDHRFMRLGQMQLKGLEDAVNVFELSWDAQEQRAER